MTVEVQIRGEVTRDIEQIEQILLSAFPTDVETKLVDAFQANGKGIISLGASDGDEVLAHILFSPVTTTPLGNAREGLRVCGELGFDYCVVLGNPHYYQRFGFEQASRFGIRNEYGVDEEFMVLRFSDCNVSGVVQYASEFGRFSV